MSKPYNGHPSWAAWNVTLWLYNEEPLYRLMQHHARHARTKDAAARALLADLPARTPDGARYTLATIRYALRDLEA